MIFSSELSVECLLITPPTCMTRRLVMTYSWWRYWSASQATLAIPPTSRTTKIRLASVRIVPEMPPSSSPLARKNRISAPMIAKIAQRPAHTRMNQCWRSRSSIRSPVDSSPSA